LAEQQNRFGDFCRHECEVDGVVDFRPCPNDTVDEQVFVAIHAMCGGDDNLRGDDESSALGSMVVSADTLHEGDRHLHANDRREIGR